LQYMVEPVVIQPVTPAPVAAPVVNEPSSAPVIPPPLEPQGA